MAFHSVSLFPSQVSVRIYFNIFLIIWTSRYNTSVTGEQESSQTVLAKVGDDVVLPCHVKSKNLTTLEWTRSNIEPSYVYVLQDGRAKDIQSNPLYKERTLLSPEGLSHGNISLKLFRAQLSDEGKFTCLVPRPRSSSVIQLFVGSVSEPVINQLSGPKYDLISWKCDSGCWYPEPEVSWLDSEGNNITAEPSVTVKPSQHCYEVQKNVTVMRGTKVTCRVHLSHINHTNIVKTPAEMSLSKGEEESGSAAGVAGWILMIISMILVAAILGYICWKKKQTGKQEDINNKAARVVQYRAELILKVSKVEDILNSLRTRVSLELYTVIKEEKTCIDQMMHLYREILEPGGAEVKAAFYKALELHEPNLLDTLEHPEIPQHDAGEHSAKEDAEKAHFVEQHRSELIPKVSRVMAIVDSLRPKINPELCTEIEAEKTTLNQMRTLYTAMTDKEETKIKAAFYIALKQHEPHLLEWLEHPPSQDAVVGLTSEDKARFVEENRPHLIKNVSRVMAVLDSLGPMVHHEIYTEIQEEKRSMDQMWILYRQILQPGGTNIRAAFYSALKKHQPHLLKILGKQQDNNTAGKEEVNQVTVSIDMDLENKPLLSQSNEPAASLGDLADGVTSREQDERCKQTTLESSHFVNPVALNMAFLDLFFTEDAISREDYDSVRSRPTTMEKMRGCLEEMKKSILDDLKYQDRINETLKELDDKEFQVFKWHLQKSENLEGLQSLPESLLERANKIDTACLIVQTYQCKGDKIVKNVREKIKQKDQVEMLPGKASPEASASDFVDQHKGDLVQRVKMIDPILDLLLAEGVIKTEDYSNVRSKPSTPSTMDKMGELYKLLNSSSEPKAKDIFYKGLQENEQFLLDDLKNPPCWTHIIDTLEDLRQDEFKDFKSYLQLSDNLPEGLQPLPMSLLENTDRMGTANLIVKTYPSNEAQIVVKFLREIDRNDLVERFQPKGLEVVNPPSVSGSEEEKGPEGEPPTPTDDIEEEKGLKLKKQKGLKQRLRYKGQEGEPPTPTDDIEKKKGPKLIPKKLKGAIDMQFRAVSFVNQERDSLIKRVTNVETILDDLLAKKVITEAEKRDMMDMPKTVHQMKKLYEILNDADDVTKAKTTFYKGLKEHEKDLLENLQNPNLIRSDQDRVTKRTRKEARRSLQTPC